MAAKILIADDEKTIRESLRQVLSEEGYETDTAEDGQEALNKIHDTDYDVVLTDIKMPNVDGMELLEKAAQFSPNTFFIIMTAYASVKTAVDAMREGAYDYLIKPVEFDDVILRVKRLVDFKKVSMSARESRSYVTIYLTSRVFGILFPKIVTFMSHSDLH